MDKDDLAMMRDSNRWPLWPRLPVKRPKGDGQMPELGVMLHDRGKAAPRIYLASVYEDLSKVAVKEYASLEAVVADGWQVD